MHQSGPHALWPWVFLACGVLALLGCQAGGAALDQAPDAAAAAEAPGQAAGAPLPPEQVGLMLERAEQAHQAGRHAEALDLLDALRAEPRVLTEEQAARVDVLWGRARNVRHQQALAAGPQELQPDAGGPTPEDTPLAAAELLAEAERLWHEKKYGQAAACVNALDPLRDQLIEADRLLYDELRRLVRLTTLQVRTLSDPDRARRAREHVAAGLRARDAGDYATASSHLRMADLFDVDLGASHSRRLRRAREQVDTALQEARADLAQARRWLETGELDQARQTLEALRDEGIRMGPQSDELDQLLAQVAQALAERERREAHENKARAADLLERATAPCEAGEFEQAAGLLVELKPLIGYLDEESQGRYNALCDAVENATGVRPGLSAEEQEALARSALEAGLRAYEEERYADARPHLDRAARLDVDLGWRGNRKLHKARARVEETLARLRSLHRTGRKLYEAGDYARAREALEEIRDSRIQIGQPEQDDVLNLLAAIDRKERQEQQARRAEVARLLSEAGELAAQEDYARAGTVLEGLAERMDRLTPAQTKEHQTLLATVREAEVRARIDRQMQEAGKLADQASELLTTHREVQQRLDACDQAVARQDFDGARALVDEAAAVLDDADPAHRAALAALADQVRRKGEDVEAARQRQSHLQAVAQRLEELAVEAAALSRSDLLAAEAKVKEMRELARREGVQLSDDQAMVGGAVIAAVYDAYRIDRWLRPTEYGRLLGIAEQYLLAGEPQKAVRALGLIRDAPAEMVDEECRSQALGKLTAARWEVGQQEAAAAQLLAACADCRASLAAGELSAAVAAAAGVLQTAREEKLSGAPLIRVLEDVVAFLGTELPPAIAEAPPELRDHVDRQLARAQVAVAERLGPVYLAEGSPELAEPYLQLLATTRGVAPASAEWARAQLTALDRLKADARQARLDAIMGDAERARKLAERLLELTRAGDVAEAEAARTELADLRVALHVKRARNALSRGAYGEAVALLEAAPTEAASEAAVANVYEPAAEEVSRARDVAANLQEAEAAIGACEVARAAELLAAVQGGDAAPSQPFQLRKQVLASVVESALQLHESHLALSARAQQELDGARASLAAARQREEAWQGYQERMEAFLTGAQTAGAPLRTVLARPGGLAEFELAEVRGIVAVLVEEEQKRAVAEAEQLLAGALLAYNAADYLAMEAALAELKDHPGFALSEALRRNAEEAETAVQEKEREAQVLYDEAVQARRAGDIERVRELLDKLKAQYGKTRAYRDRM